ncbi:MAG: aromatic ring-hydroxylating dioxygenase subunit alpha [Candidatus Pacebacteria bacterium]|nr:aromatic ring-hydroxylating dioxygenase subunit alpha [Candidatus Paceibacterota bacterium]
MNTADLMLQKLNNRKHNYSLDREFYIDPDFYKIDLETIWYRDWIFAGHDIEIPEPGNFLTLQIGEYSVMVVRDNNGEFKAYHNTCRHRGSKICLTDKGTGAGKLVCPYHQWTYNMEDGKLVYARGMTPEFNKSEHGLKPVHVEARAGYIWVCIAEEPPDFKEFGALFENYFGPHDLRNTKVAMESTIIENGNWKLVWENNRECYHCRANHPELILTFPEDPAATGVEGMTPDSPMAKHWEYCESLGLPSKFHISEDGQYRFNRTFLLPGAQSYTMDGQPACRMPLNPRATKDIGSMLLFHYPTSWNHGLVDQGVSFRVLPLSPTQTQLTTRWLVHKDAVLGEDYTINRLSEVWIATNNADRRIIQDNAAGIMSPAYKPGPYSVEQESGCIQFVDWYSDTMKTRLGSSKSAAKLRVA